MSSVMNAAVWHGTRDVRLTVLPVPEPSPGQALVRVHWVGLCGSDLEEYLEGPVVARAPRVLGHEIAGVVDRAAADGSGPPTGTRVVVDVVTGCGRCQWCNRHQEGLCPNLVVTGQHVDGGLAEFVLARADRLVPVPDGMDLRHAALAEPLAVAVRAVRASGLGDRDRIAVLGGGTVGLLCAQVALATGAGAVTVIEPSEHRRRLAEAWGALAVWADGVDERASLAESALGGAPDVVLECAGQAGSAAEAVALLAPGGVTVALGVTPAADPIDVLDVVLREKTVRGSAAHMWDDDVVPAVGLLADRQVDAEPLITHTVPLARTNHAFELLEDPLAGVVKVLVHAGPDDNPDTANHPTPERSADEPVRRRPPDRRTHH
ncbi:alcohol dehydrogenase catalytic domain-containing protein [Georgenia sp. TF02-10]|uniref:zinc-dependent alcohol dehydrogenase n=1 Tax=Georgenia sp. TF02-10 TaxID=2917725 RepID=UPI001FA7F829|nr:alcohol dehydrogenase catalytic domain-containing protein [Georgenia sp. TF02-10]UNX55795.1 alcohol dehydrogenase catalytic domain-containing protein [Georgenia sp. TF02-10]